MCKPHDLMFLEMYHVTLLLSNERAEMEEIPIHFVKSSLAPVLFVLFFLVILPVHKVCTKITDMPPHPRQLGVTDILKSLPACRNSCPFTRISSSPTVSMSVSGKTCLLCAPH